MRKLSPWAVGRLAILLACGGLIAVSWLLALERVRYEHDNAVHEVVQKNEALARTFEQQTVRSLQTIDLALQYVRFEVIEEGARANLAEILSRGTVESSIINNLGLVDVRGRLVQNSSGAADIDVSDRDYFRFHVGRSDDQLFIGKPFTGRIVFIEQIPFSRRLLDTQGNFAGVVFVSAPPSYLSDLLEPLDVGRDGIVQVVSQDGTALVRRVGKQLSYGEDFRGSTLMMLAAREPAGHFVAGGGFDKVRRFSSYRKVAGYPLFVMVGTSVDEAMAQPGARARVLYAAAAAVSLAIVILGAGIIAAVERVRRATAERRRSDERYRTTFDAVPVGMVHRALDGRFLRVNGKYCAMLGYSPRELLSMSYLEVIHPDDRTATATRRGHAGPNTPIVDREVRHLRKDGSTMWASVSVALMRDDEGKPDYIAAMVRDITERKVAEAAAAAAEVRYRATFEQAPLGIVHVSLEGVFMKANAMACRMLGYSEDELCGRPIVAVTHPDDVDRSQAQRHLAIAGDGALSPMFEKRYVRKDGSILPAFVTVAMVRNSGGVPGYFVTMIQDITERKAAEARLYEQLDELRRFQRVTIDRELRMQEVEAENRRLRERLGA